MQKTINAINTLAAFLGKRDIDALDAQELNRFIGQPKADVLILVGNCIPGVSVMAAEAFKSGIADHFIIAGGDGHTTPYLRASVNSRYPDIPTEGRAEADILSDLFVEMYSFDRNSMHLDNASLNCGANAKNALQVAKDASLKPKSAILIQDPSMQLRIDASFRKEWEGTGTKFINYSPFIPEVERHNDEIVFVNKDIWGIWSVEHYISLILGEIPRLTDDENGYGPNGQGFIAHVDIPDEVLAAHTYLTSQYEHLVRT